MQPWIPLFPWGGPAGGHPPCPLRRGGALGSLLYSRWRAGVRAVLCWLVLHSGLPLLTYQAILLGFFFPTFGKFVFLKFL